MDELPPKNPMLIMYHRFPLYVPNQPSKLDFFKSKEDKEACTTTNASNSRKNPLVLDFNTILGSCNGLVYSTYEHYINTTFFVIHPLNKECYKLPPIKLWSCTACSEPFGLGYDDSTKSFKMVCVVPKEEHITSPKGGVVKEDLRTMVHVLGTDSWREIPHVPSCPMSGGGVFANGCLHWLASDQKTIVCFDMTKEEFGLMNPPKQTCFSFTKNRLVDLDGQVGVVYDNAVDLEVWVLKQTEWVFHCRFDQRPLVNGFVKVLGFWNKDGDLLIKWRKRLFVYCLKTGNLHHPKLVDWEFRYATSFQTFPVLSTSQSHTDLKKPL